MTLPNTFNIGAQAGTNIVRGITQGLQKRQDVNAIDQILQEAQASGDPAQVQNAMSQILRQVSPERQQAAMQVLQNKMGQIQQQQSVQSFSKLTGLDPQTVQGMTPKEKEIYLTKGTFGPQQKASGDTALLQKAFGDVEDILNRGYTGKTPKSLSETGRQERAKLNTTSEIFISHLIPLINPRGTMSQSRFNYIKSLAPRGHDTDATIKGKLAGLRTIFNMNPQQLASFEGMPDKDFKALFATPQASNIANSNMSNQQNVSDEQLDALLQQTGGDIDAALQMLSGK